MMKLVYVGAEPTRSSTVMCGAAGLSGDKGPTLDFVARRLREDYFPAWIRSPKTFKPTTEMPSFDGTEDQLEAIVSFLSTLE